MWECFDVLTYSLSFYYLTFDTTSPSKCESSLLVVRIVDMAPANFTHFYVNSGKLMYIKVLAGWFCYLFSYLKHNMCYACASLYSIYYILHSSPTFSPCRFATRSFSDEFGSQIDGDLNILFAGIILIIVYTII